MNLLGAQGGGQWRKTSRDREMGEGRWVRAGWKVGAAAASGMGKQAPGARKEQWALRVASQACPEDEDGEECHVSRGVKEGLLWVFGRNRKLLPCKGKQQQRPLAGSALSGLGALLGAEEGREACWCVPVLLEGEAPQKGYFGNVWDDFGLCQRWKAILIFRSKDAFCMTFM